MSRIAYYRVSTADQSIEAQRGAMGDDFDREFADEAVSGGTRAIDRPGFAELLSYVRAGDTVCVYAIDRLGRDGIDIQQTVRDLMAKGVSVDVRGLGAIAGSAGKIILAVLAQVAEMERERIRERCEAGREVARRELQRTGKTHRGKVSLGRRKSAEPGEVSAWRAQHGASIAATAAQFGLSTATVKRYCAS